VSVTVLSVGDDDYEQTRLDAVWNGKKPDRFPDAIAIAENEEDVVEAVQLAEERDWRIGVRSGGHSWVGNAVRDGGLLLDVSHMNDFTIDHARRTASVGPGVRGPDLQRALNDAGLYFPTGTCPGVAIAGYILGGGASFTGKKDGPAAHSLGAIDVVTAGAQRLHADDDHHADLIWAARGGGPNFFAAATRFHLNVKPLPGAMYTGLYIYPAAVIDEFLDWSLDLLETTPPETGGMWMAIESWLPDYEGTMIVHFPIVSAASADEAIALLEPFERSPLLEHALVHEPPHPWSFFDGYALLDQLYVHGNRYRSDALWMRSDSAGLKQAVKEVVHMLPNRWSHVLWAPWGPSSHPNASYSLHTEVSVHPYGVCQEPADDEAMMEYVDRAMRLLMPHSIGGGKVNDCDLTAFPKDILSAECAQRFEDVRERYDPGRRFHLALGLERPTVAAM
jgi:FAD/FMN-containing dehydrogenase